MQVDPQLVAWATVVGGFSTALATLFALFAVPMAFWQAREQRKAAYVQLFYQKNAELFPAAADVLRMADKRFHTLLERAKSGDLKNDFERMIDHVDFETAWERYSSLVSQTLVAYDRAGDALKPEELCPLWILNNGMMLPFDTYIENDEVPFDEGTEFGIFLNSVFDALKTMRDLDVDPRLRAGMDVRWKAKERAERLKQ